MSLASRAELDQIRTVEDARAWIGLNPDIWSALDAKLGNVPNLRVLALLPSSALNDSIKSAVVPTASGSSSSRPLSVVEVNQAKIMRNLARQKLNLPDEDPLEEIMPEADTSRHNERLEKPIPAAQPPSEDTRPAAASSARPAPAVAPDALPRQEAHGMNLTRSLGVRIVGPPVNQAWLDSLEFPEQPPVEMKVNPSIGHVQMVTIENFYHIHDSRGLNLGPRFRAVNMAAGVPGSCYAVMQPSRPSRRFVVPSKPAKASSWWKQYVPGTEPAPPPPQERQQSVKKGRYPVKNLWPGGRQPRPGKGEGLLRELHEPILGIGSQRDLRPRGEGGGLVLSRELLCAGGLVLPTRGDHLPGTQHPALLEDDDDELVDDPWTYLPGLYDAILTCTFLEGNPTPGASSTQLPLPFSIENFRVLPNQQSYSSFLGHGHPTDESGRTHYFSIRSEDGQEVASIDGFTARVSSRPAAASPPSQPTTAASQGGFPGYVYRTRNKSQPLDQRGSATAAAASARSAKSPTRDSRSRNSTQEPGTTALTQAERDEVQERVERWSSHLSKSQG